MDLEYLKFFSWTAMWAWIMSDTVARYATPYFDKFYDIVGELAKPDINKGKSNYFFMKTVALLIEIIFAICLAYVMISWSVWCLLRCVLYTQGLDVSRSTYFITGGLICEIALGIVARAPTHRHFFSTVPYVMGMGAFVVFSMNYEPIRTTFPWMIKFVGLSSL